MRRLGADCLACLLVLVLALTGLGLGRHAAAMAAAPAWRICGTDEVVLPGPAGAPRAAHCLDCLAPALAAGPPPPAAPPAAAPIAAAGAAQVPVPPASGHRGAQGIRAPPPAG